MKSVGIFGGSFNPVHTGHIALAKSLGEKAGLDEVWLMVSPQNPFKKEATDLLDDLSRLEMVREAVRDEERLKASDYEFRLPKPSYTWHTLQALIHDYPGTEFTLLIGGDNWAAFDKWYCHEQILSTCPIVVYPRQGSPVDTTHLPPGVTVVDTPCSISAVRRYASVYARAKLSRAWCRNASSNLPSINTSNRTYELENPYQAIPKAGVRPHQEERQLLHVHVCSRCCEYCHYIAR